MQIHTSEVVRRALQGSRKVEITFKQNAIYGIYPLLEMNHDNTISLDERKELILSIVAKIKKWGHDNNRTIIVTLTNDFDEDRFVSRMYDSLMGIKIVK